MLVAGPGKVPALVKIVVDGLDHRHIQVVGAIDFDPPGDVVVLGVKGGELIQVAAGIAVHVLRADVGIAVGRLLVLNEALVLVGFGIDAADVDNTPNKHHKGKPQHPQTDAVVFGELAMSDLLEQIHFL